MNYSFESWQIVEALEKKIEAIEVERDMSKTYINGIAIDVKCASENNLQESINALQADMNSPWSEVEREDVARHVLQQIDDQFQENTKILNTETHAMSLGIVAGTLKPSNQYEETFIASTILLMKLNEMRDEMEYIPYHLSCTCTLNDIELELIFSNTSDLLKTVIPK